MNKYKNINILKIIYGIFIIALQKHRKFMKNYKKKS